MLQNYEKANKEKNYEKTNKEKALLTKKKRIILQ